MYVHTKATPLRCVCLKGKPNSSGFVLHCQCIRNNHIDFLVTGHKMSSTHINGISFCMVFFITSNRKSGVVDKCFIKFIQFSGEMKMWRKAWKCGEKLMNHPGKIIIQAINSDRILLNKWIYCIYRYTHGRTDHMYAFQTQTSESTFSWQSSHFELLHTTDKW